MSNEILRSCDFTDGLDASTGFTPVIPPPEPNIDLGIAVGLASKMIDLDLVEVEPMSGPTGILHYFDFPYGK